LMTAAMFGLYLVLCGNLFISAVMTVVMLIMTFLFAAVAGFLVSIIGSSSNPISGLTLSTLLIAAGLLVLLGMGGGYEKDGVTMSEAMRAGVIAVLGVATVVCCVAGVAGDMAQDWKVGYNLGGTPWRMEIGGFIGVIVSALFLVSIISLLHNTEVRTNLEKALKQTDVPGDKIAAIVGAVGDEAGKVEGIGDETRSKLGELGLSAAQVATVDGAAKRVRGIGSDALPAPQAGLMATTANGIISGSLPWELILMGMFFALALICVGVPSPMLVAVGMYLPFFTILAIFAGGVIQWLGNGLARRKGANEAQMETVSNRGLLVASGFVAGEALMGIVLAILVTLNVRLIEDAPAYKWLGGLVILFLAWYLIAGSLKALKNAPAAPVGKPEGSAE
ncbi:MAG TPA: OPT/YSL family transporter, partial [Polyangia bacterium]|nr:OPT/YSL family transporter [Polyangia bacterium]